MDSLLLDGYVVWLYGDPPDQKCSVQQAIFRDNEELAVDCECPYAGELYFYTFVLRRTDALRFSGTWTTKGAKHDSGSCSCRLYTNGDHIACIGSWEEEGGSQKWYAEFHPKGHR